MAIAGDYRSHTLVKLARLARATRRYVIFLPQLAEMMICRRSLARARCKVRLAGYVALSSAVRHALVAPTEGISPVNPR